MPQTAEDTAVEKVYNLDKNDWDEVPVKKEEAPDKETEDKPNAEEKPAGTEEKPTPDKETEPAEESKKTEEEPEKPEDKDKKKEEEEPAVDLDEHIKSRYAEKYEIESLQELDEVLQAADKITEENDRLKEELEAAKKAEPAFANDAQKKAYEFIKDFDPSIQGEALKTWATVVGMDVDNADGKSVLREQFILSRPEMSRADAREKFERDYARKYVPKKEKYDSDEEYEEAKKDAEIDLKADIAAGRKGLKEKKKEFQFKPTDKSEENKAPELPAEITASIKRNVSEIEAYQGKISEINFSPTGKKEDTFPVKFKKDEWSAIKSLTKSWVSNPGSYDKKGELLTKLDPEDATERAALLLYGKDILKKLYDHAKTVISTQRVEEIAKVSPDRVSKVTSATTKELSEDEQWAQIIEANNKK